MIIATPKPVNELMNHLAGCSSVLVLGCQTCVSIGRSGGKASIESTILALEMGFKQKNHVIKFILESSLRQCESEFLELAFGSVDIEYDAILSFGCAAGVQTVAATHPSKRVIPALNTRFMGAPETDSSWEIRCVGCGDCFLHETGGICVLSRCPRSMQNMSCGFESESGRCDVNPRLECVWDIIRSRWKNMRTIKARNWSLAAGGGITRLHRPCLSELDFLETSDE